MSDADALLRAAEEVVSILRHHRVDAVVIGAVALAAFNYVRYTEDVDLGVDADLPTLRPSRRHCVAPVTRWRSENPMRPIRRAGLDELIEESGVTVQ